MTYDPSDREHGIIYLGSPNDPSPIGRMTGLLVQCYKDGEEAGWDDVMLARWNALAECIGVVTFYTPEEVEAQIANRIADGKDQPPTQAKRRKVKVTRRK